jgi:hypothetical protein
MHTEVLDRGEQVEQKNKYGSAAMRPEPWEGRNDACQGSDRGRGAFQMPPWALFQGRLKLNFYPLARRSGARTAIRL